MALVLSSNNPYDDMTVVELQGDVTLQTVGAVHKDLLKAAEGSARLVIQLQPDAAVDLTGVQLLEAARRWADAAGGAVALAKAAENGLLETLRRGGFLHTPEQRRFWLKEEWVL